MNKLSLLGFHPKLIFPAAPEDLSSAYESLLSLPNAKELLQQSIVAQWDSKEHTYEGTHAL